MKRSVDEIALEAFTKAVGSNTDMTLVRLLTEKEKIMLGRRLLIATAIRAGKTRMEINEHIQVSPNTFAQINRWLTSEQNTYTTTATRPKAHSGQTPRRRHYVEPFSFENMKRRYPLHFLLFTLVEELWKKT